MFFIDVKMFKVRQIFNLISHRNITSTVFFTFMCAISAAFTRAFCPLYNFILAKYN